MPLAFDRSLTSCTGLLHVVHAKAICVAFSVKDKRGNLSSSRCEIQVPSRIDALALIYTYHKVIILQVLSPKPYSSLQQPHPTAGAFQALRRDPGVTRRFLAVKVLGRV